MKEFLSTKAVARFLDINEKMVYSLISEKGLPATKITGKWLFPRHLVEQWVENHTINYPKSDFNLPPYHGLLIIAGSNDLLLDQTLTLFNRSYPDHLAVFGNLGSLGGLRALRKGFCHMASSHLMQEDGEEYNFDFCAQELTHMPAVVNFCRREQGIMLQKGNPKKIRAVADLGNKGIRIVNRPLGTGTRLLFDRELLKAGLKGETIGGYQDEIARHMDVGLAVLSGTVDAGPGIRAVAGVLGLDFLPLRWERYDLLVAKERFFEQGPQRFINMLHDSMFSRLAGTYVGYDISLSGKMVFPQESEDDGEFKRSAQ